MADFEEYDFLQDGAAPAVPVPAKAAPLDGHAPSTREAERERPRGREADRGRSHRDRGGPRERHRDDRHRSSRHRSRSRDRERSHRHDNESRPPRDHRDRRGGPDGREDFRREPRPPRGLPMPPQPREQTPPEIRAAREREKELAALDRDIRTVFASNLPLRAGEEELFHFFSQAGTVLDVKIITDRNTRKSKGFAYVEYEKREDVVNALALTGQPLLGQTVMVKSSEAEKNMAWEAAQQQAQAQAELNALTSQQGSGPCKLLIANIHIQLKEADLKDLFSPFGPITSIEIVRDSSGQSQGYGYVEYLDMPDAAKAMQAWDGKEIVGMRVSVKIAQIAQGAQDQQQATAAPAEQSMPAVDLDERDEMGGLRLTSNARAALMSRLAGEAAAAGVAVPPMPNTGLPGQALGQSLPQPPAEPAIQWQNPGIQFEQGVLGPKSPIPTQCLLLKNMFDPAEETDPNWDIEIGNDVKEECTKFGAVSHHFVDKNSKGFVYLKFVRPEGAVAAQKALNGRWFASRQIAADFQFPASYNSYFRV